MSNQSPPLLLCQVLEEEYEALHRPLPADYPAGADQETRLAKLYELIHALPEPRSAVCFSGGGIRSATFGLGVIQGLARHGLLDKFHYVSTVSGGGYIGSWLSAWLHRRGMRRVQEELSRPPLSKLEPEPEPVRHLRSFSRYMSPRFGLLSADTWTLVAIFLRNLFLNWMVLVPLIAAALALPRLFVSAAAWDARPERVVQVVFWLGVLLGVFAVAYIVANRPSLTTGPKPVSRIPAAARGEDGFLRFCLLPLLGLTLMSTAYWAWLRPGYDPPDFTAASLPRPGWLSFMLYGALLHFGGYLVSRLWVRNWRPWEPLVVILSGAAGGLLLRLVATKVLPHETGDPVGAAVYACFAVPLFLLVFLLAATVFVGIGSYHTDDADREWLARAGAWLLIVIVSWAVVSSIVVFAPAFLLYLSANKQAVLAALGAGSGLFTLQRGFSGDTPARDKEQRERERQAQQAGQSKAAGLGAALTKLALRLALPVFAVFILVVLSLLTTWLTKILYGLLVSGAAPWDAAPRWGYDPGGLLNVIYYAPGWFVLALMILVAAVGVVMGLFVNVNKFSLHSAYRDRLIRAYLGASRAASERRPNPFTGLDEDDNVQLHELRTPLFNNESFPDAGGFVERIRAGQDGLSRFLWERIARSRQLLEDNERRELGLPPPTDDEYAEALSDDLNRLVQNEPVYEEGRFQHVKLTPEIEALLRQKPLIELLRLNRLLLERAYPQDIRPGEMRRPLHVVNMTLNLVAGKDLAWQDRKAESFTGSALHAGSFHVGYRRSGEYGMNRKSHRALSLGTSAAISGAAASPNMGYYSSPVLTFLMSLFNVRLGWWLGNPGPAGARTYNTPGPFFAPSAILAETLGRTDDSHPYVYLSDGGHFENLGLYEMILRRCRIVVVSDASADPTFSFNDLGNAVSKIRVDLGVPIEFEKIPIYLRHGGPSAGGKYCALGRIRYSCVDGPGTDGLLVYVKPTVYGREPADVVNYSRAYRQFPHESTADQLYSEQQFEAYRALGSHALEEIIGDPAPAGLEGFLERVARYLDERPARRPLVVEPAPAAEASALPTTPGEPDGH